MIFKIKYEVLRNIIYYIIKFTNIYICDRKWKVKFNNDIKKYRY